MEAKISRIKRCISSSLLTKEIASIINLWNSFGKCASVNIG